MNTPEAFANCSLELTPEAFANCSPGFELARTLGSPINSGVNPERVRQPPNPFRVGPDFQIVSQDSRSSNPGLKLANAFGVTSPCRD